MTPKNLFNIVLKIFGLFFLRDLIQIIVQFASAFIFISQSGNTDGNILEFSVLLAQIILYVFLVFIFLFKTNYLIKKLKLTKGFDQEIFSFHISASWILEISFIVIAGVILIEEIPNAVRLLYFFVSQNVHAQDFYSGIIVSAVKIIIALLLIGERKRIVGFMEKKKEAKQ
ncbi:MAG: hypothetical protein ABIY35_07120 [Chitinophagaceae bacterium]